MRAVALADAGAWAGSGGYLLHLVDMDAVREWHFRPALVQGQPARSWVEVPFSFELKTRR